MVFTWLTLTLKANCQNYLEPSITAPSMGEVTFSDAISFLTCVQTTFPEYLHTWFLSVLRSIAKWYWFYLFGFLENSNTDTIPHGDVGLAHKVDLLD